DRRAQAHRARVSLRVRPQGLDELPLPRPRRAQAEGGRLPHHPAGPVAHGDRLVGGRRAPRAHRARPLQDDRHRERRGGRAGTGLIATGPGARQLAGRAVLRARTPSETGSVRPQTTAGTVAPFWLVTVCTHQFGRSFRFPVSTPPASSAFAPSRRPLTSSPTCRCAGSVAPG